MCAPRLFPQNRLQASLIFSQFTHSLQCFGLSHGPLETQAKHLFFHFRFLTLQFIRRRIPHFGDSFGLLHDCSPAFSSRMTNFVWTASFAAASLIASRA